MVSVTEEMEERAQALYDQNGIITADLVIEDAKNPSSPFHKAFEWDVKKAALTCWRETAREIIRNVSYIKIENGQEVRTLRFLHISGQEQGYQHVAVIKSNRDVAVETLVNEVQILANVLTRVKNVAWVLDLDSQVDELLQQAGVVRKVVRLRSNRIRPPRPPRQTKKGKEHEN
jgi:hypothetical protein